MTIANMSDPNTMTGATVHGGDGEKLGKVDAIYFDTDKPEWAAVKSGLFSSHVILVPLAQGTWNNDTLTVPFDKQALQTAAPRPRRLDQPDRRGRAVPPPRRGVGLG
jgi:PRC-barrel domain